MLDMVSDTTPKRLNDMDLPPIPDISTDGNQDDGDVPD